MAGVINIRTLDGSDFEKQTVRMSGRVGGNAYLADGDHGWEGIPRWGIFKSDGKPRTEGSSCPPPLAARKDIPLLATTNNYGDHPFGTYNTSMDKTRPGYLLQGKGRIKEFSVNALAFSTEVFNRHHHRR